jgi:hypothetical protein
MDIGHQAKEPQASPWAISAVGHHLIVGDRYLKPIFTGVGEQRESSIVDFVRLDKDEKGVHFNAAYVGKEESVPNRPAKAAVYILEATDEKFKKWATGLREVANVEVLWKKWSEGGVVGE